MLTYQLDRNAQKSMYVELSDRIRHDIETGTIAANEKLPSKRSFAEHLGVSLATVEACYSQLIDEGFVRAEPRRGYFANPLEASQHQSAWTALSTNGPTDLCRLPTSNSTSDCLEFARFRHWSNSALASCQQNSAARTNTADQSRFEASLGSLPEKSWFKTIREVMNEEDPRQLLDTNPQGSIRLREAIAQELLGFRGLVAEPENIIVGAGAQYLYLLISQLLAGDEPWAVEDPGYPKLGKIYRSMGLKVAPIALDSNGMKIDELRKSGARVAHVTPSHQFPTGIIMSAPRRYELLGWANEDDRFIIEDDYDCEFRLKGRPMPSLKGIDANGRVIYMNTFSRSLWPGIRIAYAVLPPELMRKFKSKLGFFSCSVSTFEQVTLARFIELGRFDSHLNRTRKRYRGIRDSLVETLENRVDSPRVRALATDAGLHFIIEIDGADEDALKRDIARKGVHISSMHDYFASQKQISCGESMNQTSIGHDSGGSANSSGKPCARLLINYAGLAEEDAVKAMEIVTDCIARFIRVNPAQTV